MTAMDERERIISIREFFTSYECDGPGCRNFYVTGTREHRANGEEGNDIGGPHAADPTAEGWIAVVRTTLRRYGSGSFLSADAQFCSERCESNWKAGRNPDAAYLEAQQP